MSTLAAAIGCGDSGLKLAPAEPAALATSVHAVGTPIGNCVSNASCAMPLIALGYSHSVALKSDGTVWAWGDNSFAQLGDRTRTPRHSPVQVSGLSNVVAVAAGNLHTAALKSDGTVWAWGDNQHGQLGDGTTTQRTSPVKVSGLAGVAAVAAGFGHCVALKTDGTVWAWGYNYYGQLGDGTTTQRNAPVQVGGLSGVVAVAAGYCHSMALLSDGTLWAWGSNPRGELGDGSTSNRHAPVPVSGLSGVAAVAGGIDFTVVLKADGTVWAWGDNSDGQLGDGTTIDRRLTPVQVTGLSGVAAIAGSSGPGYHAAALKGDGTVWAWGENSCGLLGDGSTVDRRNTPVQVSGLSGVAALAGGYKHRIALKNDGSFWTWGCNAEGELGDGTTEVHMNAQAIGYEYRADACAGMPTCSAMGACVALACDGHGTCASRACTCDTGFAGRSCDQCSADHYGYPTCTFCQATSTCSGHGDCGATGSCDCSAEFTGAACDKCAADYYEYPGCTFCQAASTCNGHGSCDTNGACVCSSGFAGPRCQFGDATTCNGHGAVQADGGCICASGFSTAKCTECAAGYSGYPTCAPVADAGPGATYGDAGNDSVQPNASAGCGCASTQSSTFAGLAFAIPVLIATWLGRRHSSSRIRDGDRAH